MTTFKISTGNRGTIFWVEDNVGQKWGNYFKTIKGAEKHKKKCESYYK